MIDIYFVEYKRLCLFLANMLKENIRSIQLIWFFVCSLYVVFRKSVSVLKFSNARSFIQSDNYGVLHCKVDVVANRMTKMFLEYWPYITTKQFQNQHTKHWGENGELKKSVLPLPNSSRIEVSFTCSNKTVELLIWTIDGIAIILAEITISLILYQSHLAFYIRHICVTRDHIYLL